MAPKFTFEVHLLSPGERTWLAEAAKPGFLPRTAKIKLHEQLPREFYPEQIDPRLYAFNRVTPVGLWHLDQKHPLLQEMDRTIRDIRDRVLKDNTVTSIAIADIARTSGLTEEAVSHSLIALGENGCFFDEAKTSQIDGRDGYERIELRTVGSLDNYLHYEGMEDLLERFYTRRGKALWDSIAYSDKLARAPNSSVSDTDQVSKTRVDRVLDRLKNNRIVAILVVIGIIVIALGSFADSVKKLLPDSFSWSVPSRAKPAALGPQVSGASSQTSRSAQIDRIGSTPSGLRPIHWSNGFTLQNGTIGTDSRDPLHCNGWGQPNTTLEIIVEHPKPDVQYVDFTCANCAGVATFQKSIGRNPDTIPAASGDLRINSGGVLFVAYDQGPAQEVARWDANSGCVHGGQLVVTGVPLSITRAPER